jgi:hypothetical protein
MKFLCCEFANEVRKNFRPGGRLNENAIEFATICWETATLSLSRHVWNNAICAQIRL